MYLKFLPAFPVIWVTMALKQHLDHRWTFKFSTGSVDSALNPSMHLCTAGGREDLRTDKELRPSPGEIVKATWLGDNRLEKGSVVFHYYSWVYFRIYFTAEGRRMTSKSPRGVSEAKHQSLETNSVAGNNTMPAPNFRQVKYLNMQS